MIEHKSDCAVNNGPAYPAGECDCGAVDHTVTPEMVKAGERALYDSSAGPIKIILGSIYRAMHEVAPKNDDPQPPDVQAIRLDARAEAFEEMAEWHAAEAKRLAPSTSHFNHGAFGAHLGCVEYFRAKAAEARKG